MRMIVLVLLALVGMSLTSTDADAGVHGARTTDGAFQTAAKPGAYRIPWTPAFSFHLERSALVFMLKPVWAIDPLKRRSRQTGSKNCDGRPGRARKAKTGTRELPCHRRVTPCRDTTERDDISRIRSTQNQSDSSRYHQPYRYQTLSIPVSA